MAKSWLKVGALFPLALLLGACNALLETPSPLEVSLSFPQEASPGATANGTLTVKSTGYTGQVSLRLVSPTGFTLVEPSAIDVSTGTNEYLVKVRVGDGVQPRTYEVVLEVTPQGGAPIQARGTLRVAASSSNLPPGGGTPGLSAQVDPNSLTVYQGRTGNFTLTLTPSGGFTGVVVFELENGGSPVSWARLSPSYVNVTSANRQSVPVTLSVDPGAPEGAYDLTLKLIHGAGETRVPLSLTVRAPGFNISLSRTTFTLAPGGSVTSRLTVTSEGGFSGTVSFSLVGGSDARALSLTPTEVEIIPDDTSIVVPLTIAADLGIRPGEYPVYLRATSGTITRRVLIDVNVPEPPYFDLEVAPTRLNLAPGGVGILTLTVTPLHGFAGTLNLSLDEVSPEEIELLTTSVDVRGNVSQSYTLVLRVTGRPTSPSYRFRLKVTDPLGNDTYSNPIEIRVTTP